MPKPLRTLLVGLVLLALGGCAAGATIDLTLPGQRPGFEGVDYRDIGR